MSIVVHLAGNVTAEAIRKLPGAVEQVRPMLEQDAGYERAQLLVNHGEGKAQVLLQWRSFEEAVAFFKAEPRVTLPFRGLMEGTVGPYFFAIEGTA